MRFECLLGSVSETLNTLTPVSKRGARPPLFDYSSLQSVAMPAFDNAARDSPRSPNNCSGQSVPTKPSSASYGTKVMEKARETLNCAVAIITCQTCTQQSPEPAQWEQKDHLDNVTVAVQPDMVHRPMAIV